VLAERRKESLFDLVDQSKTGAIDKKEFDDLYEIIKEEAAQEAATNQRLTKKAEASSRRTKLFALFGVAMALFLGVSVAINFVVVYGVVDKQVRTTASSGTGRMGVKGSDLTVPTVDAEQRLPLELAPVLPEGSLEHMKTLHVSLPTDYVPGSYTNGLSIENGKVTVRYTVTGYVWMSMTKMYFRTSIGDEVHVDSGQSWIVSKSSEEKYMICAGNSTCSSMTVKGLDVSSLQALLAKAIADADDRDPDHRKARNLQAAEAQSICTTKKYFAMRGCPGQIGTAAGTYSSWTRFCLPSDGSKTRTTDENTALTNAVLHKSAIEGVLPTTSMKIGDKVRCCKYDSGKLSHVGSFITDGRLSIDAADTHCRTSNCRKIKRYEDEVVYKTSTSGSVEYTHAFFDGSTTTTCDGLCDISDFESNHLCKTGGGADAALIWTKNECTTTKLVSTPDIRQHPYDEHAMYYYAMVGDPTKYMAEVDPTSVDYHTTWESGENAFSRRAQYCLPKSGDTSAFVPRVDFHQEVFDGISRSVRCCKKGLNDALLGCDSKRVSSGHTWDEAKSECDSLNTPGSYGSGTFALCTKDQLDKGVCSGTGDGGDHALVWTAEKCSYPGYSNPLYPLQTTGADGKFATMVCTKDLTDWNAVAGGVMNHAYCLANGDGHIVAEHAPWQMAIDESDGEELRKWRDQDGSAVMERPNFWKSSDHAANRHVGITQAVACCSSSGCSAHDDTTDWHHTYSQAWEVCKNEKKHLCTLSELKNDCCDITDAHKLKGRLAWMLAPNNGKDESGNDQAHTCQSWYQDQFFRNDDSAYDVYRVQDPTANAMIDSDRKSKKKFKYFPE